MSNPEPTPVKAPDGWHEYPFKLLWQLYRDGNVIAQVWAVPPSDGDGCDGYEWSDDRDGTTCGHEVTLAAAMRAAEQRKAEQAKEGAA